MDQEKSCGGIVFRKHQGVIEFLVVQQTQGKHWFFPKGHVEKGETEEQTALREITEETSLQVRIVGDFKEILSYIDHTKNVEKTVVFFLCEVIGGDLTVADELQDVLWLPYEQALQTLTHENSKIALNKANTFLLT